MSYQEIELDRIKPSGFNPRKVFEGKKFDELVESIRKKGVLQPIVVRPLNDPRDRNGRDDCMYEIVAGERRWRAASKVEELHGENGFGKIPAVVRDLTDDEAYDIMTIENLQREDLTELEEAQSFKSFVDRHGEDAVKDLAGRTGIDPRYIRRRVHVLTLPAKILESWEAGKLKYGHLEQLRRLDKEGEILQAFKDLTERTSWEAQQEGGAVKSVEYLKRKLDERSVAFKYALFDQYECAACSRNSHVQKELFGVESTRTLCLDPACFKKKLNDWLLVPANWKTTTWAKKNKTNGFRFDGSVDYRQYEHFYRDPPKDCLACPKFCSIIVIGRDENRYGRDRACMDPSCYRSKFQRERGSGSVKEKAVARAKNHGEQFRELFYASRIPEVAKEIPAEDVRMARLALVAMLQKFRDLSEWFTKKHKSKNTGKQVGYWYRSASVLWPIVDKMDLPAVMEDIKEAALRISLDTDYGALGRHRIGLELGIDLAKEWRITEEYLQAKTIKEIHALANKLGLWKEKKAQAYLFEKLGKKRGAFEGCKKSQLIEIILKSGIDLANKVPTEILEIGK